MSTDLLTLTQWLSPAFPLGSFAYSHGLEQAMADGAVSDAAGLELWVADTLRFGAGRTDAALLLRARAGQDMAATARALAASKERWEETLAQGTAFVRTLTALGHDIKPAALPVVVGQAARTLNLDDVTLAQLYLQAFASNLVTIGVRAIPLGQSDGQAVLARLAPVILEVAKAAPAPLGSAAALGDLASMEHEVLPVRLFKT